MRFFDFQVNYMLCWRFHFKKEIPINRLFTQWKWTYILEWTLKMKCIRYGLYGQTAFILGEGQYAWRTTLILKDNRIEGQARRPLNPTDLDLRSVFFGSQIWRTVVVVLRPSGRAFFHWHCPLEVRRGEFNVSPYIRVVCGQMWLLELHVFRGDWIASL